MNEISIGYLSWKRNNILKQTLNSHKANGLFDIINKNNRIIFFQEISDTDKKMAYEYECKYFGEPTNIGILNGFIKLVEQCKTEYFIFSENDWLLVENSQVTKNILKDSLELLNNNYCNVVRLRSSSNPGKPLYSMPTDVEKWKRQIVNGNGCFPYKLESLSWVSKPNHIYNNILEEFNSNYKWYITTLEHQAWSNNIFIAKTDFLKETILPLVKIYSQHNLTKLQHDVNYGGLEDILVQYNKYLGINDDLDCSIKKYSNMKIAGGMGLFMHKDFV